MDCEGWRCVALNGDETQLLRTRVLLESNWTFLEQYQMCLGKSNVKYFSRNFLDARMTFRFTLIILKVTSTPLVENLKICMTETYQFEDISTVHRGWFEENVCVPKERKFVTTSITKVSQQRKHHR